MAAFDIGKLDEVIHGRVRLGIMSYLASAEVAGFNELKTEEQVKIVKEWNWLGFDGNYDRHGDDVQGFNLNEKVRSFSTEEG